MINYLIASQIMLWIAIGVLAMLCVALARQVGVLHERIAPAGALAVNTKLTVGQVAPSLAIQTISDTNITIGGNALQRSQLLFFVSPDCPICKAFLPIIKSSSLAEARWLDVILASDGETADHAGFILQYGLSGLPYVVSELLGRQFAVSKLPYAILIDEGGKLSSFGIVNTREHLESLFEAKERGVASIQHYLADAHKQSAQTL